jgi:hypothetical protein
MQKESRKSVLVYILGPCFRRVHGQGLRPRSTAPFKNIIVVFVQQLDWLAVEWSLLMVQSSSFTRQPAAALHSGSNLPEPQSYCFLPIPILTTFISQLPACGFDEHASDCLSGPEGQLSKKSHTMTMARLALSPAARQSSSPVSKMLRRHQSSRTPPLTG